MIDVYLIGVKNYKPFRNDKLMHIGGVAIFFKFSLCPVRNVISNINFQYINIYPTFKYCTQCGIKMVPHCNEIYHE